MTSQLLLRLGQCLDTEGRFDEAEPVYLDAVKNDPNLSIVHVFYCVHLEKAGRTTEAAAEYRRMFELAHHNIEPAPAGVARALISQGCGDSCCRNSLFLFVALFDWGTE